MEGLLRLFNHSINNSLRRWSDTLTHHRIIDWEKVLIPSLLIHPLPLIPSSNSTTGEDVDENDRNHGQYDHDEDGKLSGFVWAAPKRRTTVMKRMRRRFGHQDWGNPLLKPKTDLRICETCGHHYQAKHLCGNCYERIRLETKAIREKAESQIQHKAEDKGIVVLYQDETLGQDVSAKGNNQIVVEISKPRPSWFSSNLLQRTTLRVNADAKSIAPTSAVPKISSKVDS